MNQALQEAESKLANGVGASAVLDELHSQGVRRIDAFGLLSKHLAFEDVKRAFSMSRYAIQGSPAYEGARLRPDEQLVAESIRAGYPAGVPADDLLAVMRILTAHYSFRVASEVLDVAGVMDYGRALGTVGGAAGPAGRRVPESELRRVADRILAKKQPQ